MSTTPRPSVDEQAARLIELEAELESSGEASTEGEALTFARERLHAWVDTVVGVVNAAGSGRVTLIHANGTRSGISSPDLPFLLSRPVRFDKAD